MGGSGEGEIKPENRAVGVVAYGGLYFFLLSQLHVGVEFVCFPGEPQSGAGRGRVRVS